MVLNFKIKSSPKISLYQAATSLATSFLPFKIACGISPPKQAVEQINPSLYFLNKALSIHGLENIPLPLTPFK